MKVPSGEFTSLSRSVLAGEWSGRGRVEEPFKVTRVRERAVVI